MNSNKETLENQMMNIDNNEFLRYHERKRKEEELFRALYSGNGIQGIINTAYTYLENPITICDTSFSILNSCPAVNDPRNLDKVQNRFFLKEIFLQKMQEEKIVDRIFNSHKPFSTKIEDFDYDWVFAGIRIQRAVVGYICIRGMQRTITSDDMLFIEILSQMISVEMQKDSAYSHPTGLKYEYFLTELLEGNFDRTEYISHQLIQLGHKPTPFYYILLFQFKSPESRHPSTKYYYEQILSILPGCMVVLFQNVFTVLLPSKQNIPFSESTITKLSSFLQLNNMKLFISYPFTEIEAAPFYFQQVHSLLSLPNIRADENHFIYYNRYFLRHIFSQCPNIELLKASIHPDILQMQKYDSENKTEYTKTLRTYLLHNRNAVSAAQALHIHKSTFFYRLSKISDLFGLDVSDELLLFSYEYSFRVITYLNSL